MNKARVEMRNYGRCSRAGETHGRWRERKHLGNRKKKKKKVNGTRCHLGDEIIKIYSTVEGFQITLYKKKRKKRGGIG